MKNNIHRLIYTKIKNTTQDRISIKIEMIILFAIFFMIYSYTISNNLSLSHDSIKYINRIDGNIELFHPHHLLYNGFAVIWVSLLRIFGNTSDSVYLVSLLNSIFGALVISIFYVIGRRYFIYFFLDFLICSSAI